MGWLARSDLPGVTDRVSIMVEAHVAQLETRFAGQTDRLRELMQQVGLILNLTAYAESAVGGLLGEALRLPAQRRRDIVAQALAAMKAQLTETPA